MAKTGSSEKPVLAFIYGAAFGAALATVIASVFFALRPDRARVNLERQLIEVEQERVLEPVALLDPSGETVRLDPTQAAIYYFHLEGCPACARAKEALGRWLAARPEAPLVVVAVPRGDGVSPELKEEMLAGPWRAQGRVRVYFDPDHRVLAAWGVRAFPTVLAVRERRVVGRLEGFPRGDANLPRLLDRLLETLETEGKGGES